MNCRPVSPSASPRVGFAKGGGNYGAATKLAAMGVAIPAAALPTRSYLGEPRIFVLSERTMVDPASEAELNVSVIVLAKQAQVYIIICKDTTTHSLTRCQSLLGQI
jgi:hypothetical protein